MLGVGLLAATIREVLNVLLHGEWRFVGAQTVPGHLNVQIGLSHRLVVRSERARRCLRFLLRPCRNWCR